MYAALFEVNGARVSRLEDCGLVTGSGKYASDWNLPGQLYGHFLRSDRAHARIVSLNIMAEQLGVEPSQISYAAGEFHCSEPVKTITLHELAGKIVECTFPFCQGRFGE